MRVHSPILRLRGDRNNSFKARYTRLLRKTYLFWHAVSLLNFVLIEEQHAHCGLPRGFGGSPGPEKDCGWYCEFVLGSETWAFGRK